MRDNDEIEARKRWWPAARNHTFPSMHAGQLIAEVLGPTLNHELPSVLEEAQSRGVELSDELNALMQSLQQADGRELTMLPLLAGAVAICQDVYLSGAVLSERAPGYAHAALSDLTDIVKMVGDVAYVAATMYGFDEQTWSTFVGTPDDHATNDGLRRQWPPRGIDYRPHF